jgi:hypothetical protein
MRGGTLRALLVWSGVAACASRGQPLPFLPNSPLAQRASVDTSPGFAVRPHPP